MNRPAFRPTFAADATPGFITTHDDERLSYQDWGRGRPVVFVHGWAMNAAFWEYQTGPLAAEGLRCIAYDQRGCGRSSPAGGGYDLDSLADDLDAVMQALDLRDAVLVSHSMGSGQVARYLARHGASRVGKVVLVNCTTPRLLAGEDNPDGLPPEIVEQSTQAMLADRPRYVAEMAGPFFHPAPVSPELVRWGIGLVLGATLVAAVEMNHTNLTADLRHDMAAFTVPTLVIHGGMDSTSQLDLTSRVTTDMIPGAELVVYEDAPHGLPLTHAARLNRDLAAFARG